MAAGRSLVWLRVMALARHQLPRRAGARRLARRLSAEQIADLWPAYPESAPITLVELARALPWDSSPRRCRRRRRAGSARMPGWSAGAIDHGRRCSPTIRISACRRPACGISRASRPRARAGRGDLAGRPAVVLGHNGAIAWGFTNTGADTQDLFIERVDPEDPTRSDSEARRRSPARRGHRVEGGAPVELGVRETRHGPVIPTSGPKPRPRLAPTRRGARLEGARGR